MICNNNYPDGILRVCEIKDGAFSKSLSIYDTNINEYVHIARSHGSSKDAENSSLFDA